MQFLGVSYNFPCYVPPVTAWLMHGPFAHWLVSAQKPRRVVELGTHYGYSYFCFCEAIKANGIQADCYAVDTWRGDEHAGFYGDEVYQAVIAENAKYSGFSTLLRKTFSEALADIPDGTVDLLHVDGRHYYEDVKEDFESWVPKLSDSAVVLFHDTEVRERDFGIWRYWAEISVGRTALNLPYQHGLGVLFWGKHPPQDLIDFADALRCPTARPLVVDHFSSTGDAFSREREAAKLSSDRIAQLTGKLDGEIQRRDAAVDALNIELDAAVSSIAELRSELGTLRTQYDVIETDAKGKQDQIEALSCHISAMEELLKQARKAPLSGFANLMGFRLLCLIRKSPNSFSVATRERIDQLISQLDPERKDHFVEESIAVDRSTNS